MSKRLLQVIHHVYDSVQLRLGGVLAESPTGHVGADAAVTDALPRPNEQPKIDNNFLATQRISSACVDSVCQTRRSRHASERI
jgi:hypothetical protein